MSEHRDQEEHEENDRAERGFRIVDRRRFTGTGETRTDAPPDKERTSASVLNKTAASEPSAPPPAAQERATADDDEIPEPAGRIDFISFIASLATNAMAALGALPEGEARGVPRNPELAREYIDIVAMLHHKTRGNLTAQENAAMKRIVGDLKMAYVQMTGDFTAGSS